MLSVVALADSSAVTYRTLKHVLKSSIPAAVANFASACEYLCYENCLVLKLYVCAKTLFILKRTLSLSKIGIFEKWH